MRLPKSRMIFGQKWSIHKSELHDSTAGLCDKGSGEIHINDRIKEDVQIMATLLHEMGHGMFHRIGLEQAISHELEEIITESFATMIIENFNLTFKKQ